MDKLCLRSYIKSRQLLGLIAKEIHAELATTYGHGTVSYRTVARWDYRFPSGRESIEGDPRQGRPIIVVTQKRIDAVKDLVNEDPHISIDYLAYILDISHGSVDTILEQHLRLKKRLSQWVPHNLTRQQRQQCIDICTENLRKIESRDRRLRDIITGDETWIYHRKVKSRQESKAWVASGRSPPTEVKRHPFEVKTIFVVFLTTTAPLLIYALPSEATINAI